MFGKQSPQDGEGIDLSLLIFCNDVGGVGVRLSVLRCSSSGHEPTRVRNWGSLSSAQIWGISETVALLNLMEKDYPVCYVGSMNAGRNPFLADLGNIVIAARDRQAALQQAAALIRSSANYRWVGLYDMDHAAGLVRNVTWSGPGAPEHPTFPLTKGLTSAAVAQKQIVNVGDVWPMPGT